MIHFGITVILIFLAGFTKLDNAVLLLISLSYCLAGVYLDRNMFFVGILSALVYLGIFFDLINSNLMVGAIFAAGFFVSAGAAAKQNSDLPEPNTNGA